MKLGLHQSARLEQRLVQSPQMIQAMQILQLPSLDLQERIEQELVENPFLELAEEGGEEPREEGGGQEEAASPETDGLEHMLEELERYERDFGDGPQPRMSSEEGDRKYEAMQNAPDQHQTLAEGLLDQVAFLDLSERGQRIVEYLVWSLDERGYLDEPLEVVAEELTRELGSPVPVEEVENALFDLRAVTHPGIGARDLRECLLLQVPGADDEDSLVRTLIESHLEDIEHNRLPRIARTTGRELEEIKDAIELVRTLDPTPGADFGETRADVITPDVVVEEVDGEYVVRLERQRSQELTVSPAYRQMLRQAQRGDGVREWVKKRVESARWFIDAVQQRQATLQRIADSIFTHQREFLDRGVSGLRPLRMQEVADEIGVHISTVSRGVSGKYAQTPRGIFPLKYFFTGGTAKSTGEVASQASIKERIRELVDQEDKQSPLSDDQLAARLSELDGIQIARRTVTKYRKALDIPSSTQRRSY